MVFICEHCELPIHGVSSVHDGKFMHHRCVVAYDKAKLGEELEEEIKIV